MTLVRFLDNAFGAEETCFFDTFFLLVALTDFTVFFEEDFFAADFFAAAFFDGAFFAARFLADLTGFPRLTDAAERREDALALDFLALDFLALDTRALDFLALFFLLTALDDLFAVAFFAGIARASEGFNETGDYTYAPAGRKYCDSKACRAAAKRPLIRAEAAPPAPAASPLAGIRRRRSCKCPRAR